MSPLAKIIKHSRTSPVSHTILINNTPQAHKIFGVLNPPLPSANQNTVFDQSANQKTALDNTANQNEIIVQEDITSEDLDFSDVDRNDDAITNDVTKNSDNGTEHVTEAIVESDDNPEKRTDFTNFTGTQC